MSAPYTPTWGVVEFRKIRKIEQETAYRLERKGRAEDDLLLYEEAHGVCQSRGAAQLVLEAVEEISHYAKPRLAITLRWRESST